MKKILIVLFIAMLPLPLLVYVVHKPQWELIWLDLVALGCIAWIGRSKGVTLAIFFLASEAFVIFSFVAGSTYEIKGVHLPVEGALGLSVYLFLVGSLLFLASELILVSQGGKRWDCFWYLLSFVTGGLFTGSYIIVEDGQPSTVKSKGALAGRKVANLVVIHNEQTVVFEQMGRFTRIAGPGVVFTKPFESIRKVLITRQRFQQFTLENALTKDGIAVDVHMNVLYRIAQDPSKLLDLKKPYPFSEEAVLKATYASFDWEIATREVAKNLVRDLIARRHLDELYEPLHPDRFPLEDIRRQVQQDLAQIAEGWGAQIVSFRITGVDTPPDVRTTLLQKWEVDWENILAEGRKKVAITAGEAEAAVMNLVEVAKAQAQTRMVIATTEGITQMRAKGVPVLQVLATRFIDALERMASEPMTRVLLPADIVDTLKTIREAIERS